MQYYNSSTVLYLNREFIKSTEAHTDLYGQSLHYGYAVFEGLRAYKTHNGVRVYKAAKHFERLKHSCELLNIPFTWDTDELIRQTDKLLEMNNLRNAYIRPLVYCPANMQLSTPTQSSIMICAWEWDAYWGHRQLNLGISNYHRPNPKSTAITAKVSGNYVSAILASTEAKHRGFDEALLLDSNGNVAQAPGSNIFFEKDGKLYTPSLGHILPGITRATVIELCNILDIEVIEKTISLEELKNVDSAFLCGTATEIATIASINHHVFKLAWNESIGATIQRAYKNLVLDKVNYEVII